MVLLCRDFSLAGLCLYIFFPSWTTRAQNDVALLYTFREIHSSFIPHLLGPVPTLLPNFLCCSYVCLLRRSFWSRSSTCPEYPFLIFICPSGLSLNVTSSTGPVLCKVPPKGFTSHSVILDSFLQGAVTHGCARLLVQRLSPLLESKLSKA